MAGTQNSTVPLREERPVGGGAGGRQDRNGHTDEPGGRVVIGAVVVEKIAVQAVREVPGALTARSRPARARVSGEVVLLRLRVRVHYPWSVHGVCVRAREHVKQRIERITGKQVHHIDIEIVELVR